MNSLEMYLNWMKRNQYLKNELTHSPLEIEWSLLMSDTLSPEWWKSNIQELDDQGLPIIKINRQSLEMQYGVTLLQTLEIKAKEMHINSDIKKSIFYTLMTCEDYIDAYEKLIKLDLKKTQEREIVKVLVQCAT